MPIPDPSSFGDLVFAFLSIVLEGAPYILLGTVISGFIDAYLPAGAMDRLLPRNKVPAIFISGLLGGIFPVCECAIVPVIRRLVQKGLPVSCAITYMLSAPIINPIVVVSTLSAFNNQRAGEMTLSRLLMAYIITVAVGLAVHRFSAQAILKPSVLRGIVPGAADERERTRESLESDHDDDHGHGEEGHGHGRTAGGEKGSRLVQAMRTAQHDFLDTAMYFVIGVMIAAAFNTKLQYHPDLQDGITSVAGNDIFAVPIMMAFAFVLSLCSTTDAFIVAPMQAFSMTAKLGFLVFGPMMDVKLLFMYSSVFKKRFVLFLVGGLFLLTVLLCIPWSAFLNASVTR